MSSSSPPPPPQQQQQATTSDIASVRHSVHMVVDQHSNEMKKLADEFGLIYARDSMCGFIAMATAFRPAECLDSSADIFKVLEKEILPWINKRRQEYIDQHLDEFVPQGTPHQEAQGRMSVPVYKGMMCSSVEIAHYLSTRSLVSATAATTDTGNEIGDEDRATRGVALLCNIMEGPPVDETSLRFPRQEGSFIAQEELEYIQQEKPFWESGVDQYVQVATTAGDNKLFLSVKDFVDEVVKVANRRKEWNVIIDSNCHYHVLRISFEKTSSDDSSSDVMVLEEVDSMKREVDCYKSQPCENLVLALRKAWQVEHA